MGEGEGEGRGREGNRVSTLVEWAHIDVVWRAEHYDDASAPSSCLFWYEDVVWNHGNGS